MAPITTPLSTANYAELFGIVCLVQAFVYCIMKKCVYSRRNSGDRRYWDGENWISQKNWVDQHSKPSEKASLVCNSPSGESKTSTDTDTTSTSNSTVSYDAMEMAV